MRRTKKTLRGKRGQSGQSVVEYVLILAVIATASLSAFSGLSAMMRTGFLRINAEIEKSLATGSFYQGNIDIHKTQWSN